MKTTATAPVAPPALSSVAKISLPMSMDPTVTASEDETRIHLAAAVRRRGSISVWATMISLRSSPCTTLATIRATLCSPRASASSCRCACRRRILPPCAK